MNLFYQHLNSQLLTNLGLGELQIQVLLKLLLEPKQGNNLFYSTKTYFSPFHTSLGFQNTIFKRW